MRVNLTHIGLVLGVVAAGWTFGLPIFSLGKMFGEGPLLEALSPKWQLAQIASDIVQSFAILAALVVQVIALVAMVFNPGSLSPEKVKAVTAELTKMQQQLLALFGIYVATLAVALAAKIVCLDDGKTLVEAVVLSVASFMVVFSLGRTAEMGRAIMSVHRLRSELLVAQAIQDRAPPRKLPIEPDPAPEAYGRRAPKQ